MRGSNFRVGRLWYYMKHLFSFSEKEIALMSSLNCPLIISCITTQLSNFFFIQIYRNLGFPLRSLALQIILFKLQYFEKIIRSGLMLSSSWSLTFVILENNDRVKAKLRNSVSHFLSGRLPLK